MLALLLLALPHGCKEGSRFEDCEEYLRCLADPPSCTELVIEDNPTDPDGGSHNIIGTIPSAIGNLFALTNLVIAESRVSGTIPHTIGLLTMLESLDLASDAKSGESGQLSGTLPTSLGNLTRLEILLVYQTQISGTLPPSLGELTALELMSMFGNLFTGVIPEIIFELTTLTDLDLSINKLSGTLSKSCTELTALTQLAVANNFLSGTLSENIGKLLALKELRMDSNYLSGTLPETIGELTALALLSSHDNYLSGTLSETIGDLTALAYLTLHDNHLSGTLPQSISKMTALTWLQLSNNKISGTVPDTLSALTSLTTLYLQNNSFTAVGGGICAIQDFLTSGCDLSNNEFPGTYDAQGGKMNCPVCLNDDGNCNKHNQGTGGDEPVFPNKACDFTSSSCACFAPSPSTAPTTIAPTMMSHAVHRWEQLETTLCFGFTNKEAPHCGEVVLAVLIGAVLALTCVFCLYIVISRQARRNSTLNGTPYVEALGYAFTSRCCWCYTQRWREEHARRTVEVAAQTESMLEAPFLPRSTMCE